MSVTLLQQKQRKPALSLKSNSKLLASAAVVFFGMMSAACSTKSSSSSSFQSRDVVDLIPGVSIVYSANLQGEIEPCGCRTNPSGGLDRRWNLIAKHAPGEKLSIDSGDLFYKSTPVPPFLEEQWNYQANVLVDAYNQLGMDVVTPGELEFAAGVAQFEKLKKKSNFKFVSANIYKKSPESRLLDSHIVLTKGGRKVGLFGIYGEELSLPESLEARDAIAAAKDAVAKLKKETDVIIALTHQGLDKDQELAKAVPEIDYIFGAHTQNMLVSPVKIGNTLIFEASFRGQHIGIINGGKHTLVQADESYLSVSGAENPFDTLVTKAKIDIAEINRKTEATLFKAADTGAQTIERTDFQTFPKCAECHTPQYAFYKNTQHAKAYQTLVTKKQNANLDCMKCHTLGLNQPSGYKHVDKLVFNAANQAIDAESFAKSLPKMKIEALTKISKAYINVQCEHCHVPKGNHPFSGTIGKTVSKSTCLNCHTPEQAPGWHKDGKPDEALIQAKMKSVSCPAMKKE